MPTSRGHDSQSSRSCSRDFLYLWIVYFGYNIYNSGTVSHIVLDSEDIIYTNYNCKNNNNNSNINNIINFIIIIIVVVVFFVVIETIMFRNKRKDSAIRTLVAETLVLAKTHGYVEKIEHELEEELLRETKGPPNRVFAKWRHKGEKLLKNKYTLLTVAIFCVTECALILGELILDLHKVKDVLEAQEEAASTFVEGLHKIYPVQVPSADEHISKVFDRILISNIQWKDPLSYSIANNNQSHTLLHNQQTIHNNTNNSNNNNETTRHRRSMGFSNSNNNNNDKSDNSDTNNVNTKTLLITSFDAVYSNVVHNLTSRSNNATPTGADDVNIGSSSSSTSSATDGHGAASTSAGHSVEEEVAHALHMASITILSILVFQTILKALCAGSAFFHRKLETFDLCVVLISFVVDLVCMQIMPRYKIQDFVFILAFLLPWRVIRVVNSLVVAVQDHEHFRLKLIYGRKKKIVNSLRESEVKLQLFRAQCNALKRLCYNEGIEEAKVDQILMVEECVVTKAGKSKCKVKIDNSSVIVLNDKSDFPRLSPRPSILNLFDYGSRRKSMQPQSLSSNDREFFLKTSSKDSSSKKGLGFLRTRTRSNSESGRGTLSSPDESGTARGQNSFGESAISGLNTPVLIDRKSSLNSPIIANHVKNILSSLESGGVPSENCSSSSAAYRYGRGSLDEGNKQGSRESEGKGVRDWVRNSSKTGSSDSSGAVDCGSGSYGGVGGGGGHRGSISNEGGNCNGYSRNGGVGPGALPTLKSRRGSLQPQKRVDEDEDFTILVPSLPPPPQSSYNTTTVSVHKDNDGIDKNEPPPSTENVDKTTNNPSSAAILTTQPKAIIPDSTKAIETTTTTPSQPTQLCLASIEKDAEDSNYNNTNNQYQPQHQQQQQPPPTGHTMPTPRRSLDYSIHESPHEGSTSGDLNLIELSETKKPMDPPGFRPKALRTSSDIENENNLTMTNETAPPSSSCNNVASTTALDETSKAPKVSSHGTPLLLTNVRHSSITEEPECLEAEKEDEIMV